MSLISWFQSMKSSGPYIILSKVIKKKIWKNAPWLITIFSSFITFVHPRNTTIVSGVHYVHPRTPSLPQVFTTYTLYHHHGGPSSSLWKYIFLQRRTLDPAGGFLAVLAGFSTPEKKIINKVHHCRQNRLSYVSLTCSHWIPSLLLFNYKSRWNILKKWKIEVQSHWQELRCRLDLFFFVIIRIDCSAVFKM